MPEDISERQSALGSVPDARGTAVLLIDVISDFCFPGGAELAARSRAICPNILELRRHADDAGVPVIYANDNYGQWRSDFRQLVDRASGRHGKAPDVAEALKPRERDYFVLKPRHSAFYATPLDLLLNHLGARTVVLAGYAAEMCVMYTAMDAYIRGFEVVVATDCVTGHDPRAVAGALEHMETVMGARLIETARLPELVGG